VSARAWAVWITVLAVLLFVVALFAMSSVRTPVHPAPDPMRSGIQLETL